MSTPNISVPTPSDDIIEKQERIEAVIDQRTSGVFATQNQAIATKANRGTSAVPATTAPSATYIQAEAASVRAAVEAIRAALVSSGVIAS